LSITDLFKNFFTHKDFLPPASEIPGTMFTPLHIAFSVLNVVLLIFLCIRIAKLEERIIKRIFACIWISVVLLEFTKIAWESLSGANVNIELGGVLPLYPCSIFMYAMPFAIWGKGILRRAGCGYVCTLGIVGAAVNYVYPATILSNYSCISFAGFHTFFYHGAILFCAVTMLCSGYHCFKGVNKPLELLIPSLPFLAVSVIANLVNFSKIDSDYMFFKLESFIFAPIGKATPDWFSVIAVYAVYIVIHAIPYIPSYISSRRQK